MSEQLVREFRERWRPVMAELWGITPEELPGIRRLHIVAPCVTIAVPAACPGIT